MQRLRLGGKADEVVDHYVDRAADRKARHFGQVESLGTDPLAGKGGITMQDERKDAPSIGVAPPGLIGLDSTHGDGVYRLEMARVGHQVDVDFASVPSSKRPGGSQVVFDVAGAHGVAGVNVLEAGEEVHKVFADDVGHHVESATMAHGQDAHLGRIASSALERLGQERNQGFDPFDREALVADVTSLQHLLEGG